MNGASLSAMKYLFLARGSNRQYSVERLKDLHERLLQNVIVGFFDSDEKRWRYSHRPILDKIESSTMIRRKQEPAASAFRDISVSVSDESYCKEGDANSEKIVVETIRMIGQVLVNAETIDSTIRSDPAFEYFCESAMLPLLVDICRSKPLQSNHFYDVVWSPLVKAQVLSTVTLLISNTRDTTALYFCLSQNCINDLICCIQPLSQWTDPALEVILPSYVNLLSRLALQLSASPHLYALFGDLTLFSATLQTAQGSYKHSDSFAHATCLTLLVDMLQIEPVHLWFAQRPLEQNTLCQHLGQLLLDRYRRFQTLVNGPVVNAARSNAVGEQMAGLTEHIGVVNDIFWCSVQGLNVRLCETLLQRVLWAVLCDLLETRHFLRVGVLDSDVIPEEEAKAQAAMFFLCILIQELQYAPLVRMLIVALFHESSTSLWSEVSTNEDTSTEKYPLTLALNAIAQGKDTTSVLNPYRNEVIKVLKGEYGEWRLVPAAILLENVLRSPFLDLSMLEELEILAKNDERHGFGTSAFELAMCDVLDQPHTLKSDLSIMVLECVSSLAITSLHTSVRAATNDGSMKPTWIARALLSSTLLRSLQNTRNYFFRKMLEFQELVTVSDIYVDLIENVVRTRYKRNEPSSPHRSSEAAQTSFSYVRSQHGCMSHSKRPDVLVRKLRGVDQTEIESARFNAQMAIHFRALCQVMDRLADCLESWDCREKSASKLELHTEDTCDKLSQIFGRIREAVRTGADLDLRGRMAFRFTAKGIDSASMRTPDTDQRRERTLSEDMIFTANAQLVLVLDPTDMFVVKPSSQPGSNNSRGTVICCIPLLNIIAAAADEAWLHIAVRHSDVGFLIKNGNMAVCFESVGTCLIVKQYLDRCRQILRGDLSKKIRNIFAEEICDVKGSPEPSTVA